MEVSLVVFGSALVALLVAGWKGSRGRAQGRDELVRRVLQHVQRVALANLPTGPAATAGRVTAREALVSPLTGRRCVAFRLDLYVFRDHAWRPAAREQRVIPFELHDGDHVLSVQAAGADVFPARGRRWNQLPPEQVPPALVSVLQAHGVWPLPGPLLAEEWLIAHGDEVAVFGVVERQLDPRAAGGGGYRTAAPTRPVMRRTASYPLVISNEDHALRSSGRNLVPGQAPR